MKATRIDLPPDVEGSIQRVNIGGDGYETIPAVKFPDPAYPGFVTFLSRWVPEDPERMAIGRSSMRAALLAFAVWATDRTGELTFTELVEQFVEAHPETFGAADADVWYQRLMNPGDSYQPMRLEVCAGAPIEAVEHDPPPLPGPRLVQ